MSNKKIPALKITKCALFGIALTLLALVLNWQIWPSLVRQSPEIPATQRILENQRFAATLTANNPSGPNDLKPADAPPETEDKPLKQEKTNLREEGRHSHNQAFSAVHRHAGSQPDPLASLEFELQPRSPHPPMTLRMPPGNQMRLTVKFMDWAMARLSGDNQMQVSAATAQQVHELVALARKPDLVFAPALDSPEKLDALRIRAARRSKTMQADLNGTMTIDLSLANGIMEVAKSLQS